MKTCPGCGEEVGERAKFCAECGTPLAAQAPAREERKVVTVVFCDLVGSTAQAERLDPEDVRAMLSRYHEQVRTELERFGGTVEKFIGDAVMAVFGAPVAHEDDAERAVRAALAVRDAATSDGSMQVRVAVNTGEALVALDARPFEGEAMVAGDVVNTAARLQSAAPPNGIFVGEQTYRATDRVIDYRPHEPVQAKGKTEPVKAWEAVQARARLGVDVGSYSTPLVGRGQELELLVAALLRSRTERTPQLVTIVGTPGIGKSRLLAELFGVIERGDELITWRQGRSLPYGEGVSFWALGEMVKAQAGILDTDAPDEAAAKLGAMVRGLLDDPVEAPWVEGHLRRLAGIAAEETAGDRRGETFAAWRRFFEALAEVRPLVLVFEDMHWADDGLLDFVDHLVDWLADVPVLVVVTARPELLGRRPAWGGGKANATIVSLSPLSDTETAALVHGLLDKSVLPADVQATLLERAGGNPLYAEEFVRMFAERGLDVAELPESVQGIIAARLDGLSSADKELLQDAAVVGKVFWSGALAELGSLDRFEVEERLHALERRELLRRERRSSVAGESEYAFRHLLVRDVAYGTIPRAARVERHRLAAAWIESLGRPEDHADLLAHHYLSALELARAAGLNTERLAGAAASALRRAGDRAFGLNAFVGAVRFYDAALELGVDEDVRPQLLSRLGGALHYAGDDRQIDVLERAREAHLSRGDPESAAEAHGWLADAWWLRGQGDRAQAYLAEALELVEGRGPSPAAARVRARAARLAMLAGQYLEAERLGAESLAVAEELGLEELRPQLLNTIGVARCSRGDRGGLAEIERAIELGLATNDPDLPRAYNNLAAMLTWDGQLLRAREVWLEAKEVARRFGSLALDRWVTAQLVWVDYYRGRWADSLTGAEAFIAECEAGSPHYLEAQTHSVRAGILLARDDVGRALASSERGRELARQAGDPQALHSVLGAALRLELELDRVEEARALAEGLLASIEELGGDDGLMELAIVAERLGIAERVRALVARASSRPYVRAAALVAEGRYAEAAERLAATGDRITEAAVRRLAAAGLRAEGRHAEADEQLQQALAFYRSVGATRFIRASEALLAQTA